MYVEVCAIFDGLQELVSATCLPLVVESDNVTAILLLVGDDDVLTLVKSVVEDIWSIESYREILFRHIRQS